MKKARLKPVILIFAVSLLISLAITAIYNFIPPFYITSVNVAIVPQLEVKSDQYNYNGFYQSEVSENIVKSVSLFAASNDFKKTVATDLNTNVLYLLAKTHGTNIVSVQVVTLKPMDVNTTSEAIKNRLNDTLKTFLPTELSYKIHTLNDFNHNYTGSVTPTKFFSFIFAITLMVFSVLYMLKSYYYGK